MTERSVTHATGGVDEANEFGSYQGQTIGLYVNCALQQFS